MRKRFMMLMIASAMAMALISTGSAGATTVVGSNCAATLTAPSVSIVSLKNPAGYPLPSAIPSAGVITSWSFSLGGPLPAEFQVNEKLKVFSPTGVPGQLKVVGESPASVSTGFTTTPTRIAVQSGDLLGSSLSIVNSGKLEQGAIFCKTENAEDEIGRIPGDPVIGATVSMAATEVGFQNPITVTVEPDADGDGYGDETQDKCPTDASTQGPCPAPKVAPAPPTPITLSASAAPTKGLLTVTLTDSAQATVSVGGSVKLGKGKTVKLSGGTQIVAPGSLAKFTILFPAKLKTALKQLPSSKKLSLILSATAPGATAKSLTVKVPGQEKARSHSRSKR